MAQSYMSCATSNPSCSYSVTPPRAFPQLRTSRTSRRSVRRGCSCAATTPAQLDSALAQDNGVGKAQAGTCTLCMFKVSALTVILPKTCLGCPAAHSSEAAVPILRSGRVKRQTKETKVDVTISIDGTGRCRAKTPIHFLNHMLDVSRLPTATALPQLFQSQ